MKSKFRWGVVFVAFLGVPLLWAGDPWKEKPYTEWSLEDVIRTLNKSPWTRMVLVGGLAGGVSEPGVAEQRGGVLTRDQWENEQIAAAARRLPPSGGPLPTPHLGPSFPGTGVYVAARWVSSQTVRQAVARYWQLVGQLEEDAVRRLASSELEYHTVGLIGLPLEDSGIETVRQTASLHLLPSRRRVVPVSVERVRGSGLAPIAEIFVHFPKQVEGRPLFTAKEQKAEFSCRYGFARVKVTFDLRKMIRDGKPDL